MWASKPTSRRVKSVSVAEEAVHQLRSEGLEATSSRHDISDWHASRELVGLAIDTYGRLDGVVNNAGILRDRMLFNMSSPEWDDVVGVHLRGTAAVLSAAAAYWRASTSVATLFRPASSTRPRHPASSARSVSRTTERPSRHRVPDDDRGGRAAGVRRDRECGGTRCLRE